MFLSNEWLNDAQHMITKNFLKWTRIPTCKFLGFLKPNTKYPKTTHARADDLTCVQCEQDTRFEVWVLYRVYGYELLVSMDIRHIQDFKYKVYIGWKVFISKVPIGWGILILDSIIMIILIRDISQYQASVLDCRPSKTIHRPILLLITVDI